MKISILDTETTGLDTKTGKVIEVCIANFCTELNDVIDIRSWLLKSATDEEVKNTQRIHGISPEMIAGFGRDPSLVFEEVDSFVVNSSVVIAHNADFDRQWFNGKIKNMPWVCSLQDFVWPSHSESKSLTALCLAHGVGVVSAHRAAEDVMSLARLLKRVKEYGQSLPDIIANGMRPKKMVAAIVSYDDRNLAKENGFKWDGELRAWKRKMPIDDIPKLPFRTRDLV